MKIVNRLFELMKEKKIKGSELANYIGVKNQIVSAWKKRETNPPAEYIAPIAELLEVSTDFLLTGKEKKYTAEEQKIINAYRMQDEGTRRAICKILDVEREEPERSSESRTG